MKKSFIKIINRFFFYPPKVRNCSQTIYETLLGCLRLWDSTKEDLWRKRADKVCSILLQIQRPDGGFDIGYKFNFGLIHKKGDSTSPELIGLLALVEYYKRFPCESVKEAAYRAANWIRHHAIKISEKYWAIPYSPYNIKEVMVYNGTSFASGALGVYLSQFPDNELEIIYRGMICYLHDVMSEDFVHPGKFWYYSDQSRKDLSDDARNKIDYYHQMQQVEMHSLAQINLPDPLQLEMIKSATDYVMSMQDETGVIPYLNTPLDVHVWGYSSCLSGFLLAAKLLKKESSVYIRTAKKNIEWLSKYSWNGSFFYPTLKEDGTPTTKRYYVRSDAWVFNSLALAINEGVAGADILSICENTYKRMERYSFSGLENHASNTRLYIANRFLQCLLALRRRFSR